MKQVNQVWVDVDSESLVCAMQRDGKRHRWRGLPALSAAYEVYPLGHQECRPARVCLRPPGFTAWSSHCLASCERDRVMVFIRERSRILPGRACSEPITDAVDAGGILEYLNECRLPHGNTAPEILE